MEKANILKILEGANQGLKLYSPAYGEIELEYTDCSERMIKATPMIRCKRSSGTEAVFFCDGCLSTNGECMLFPNKESRTWNNWEKYLLKKGDVVVVCYPGLNGTIEEHLAVFLNRHTDCTYALSNGTILYNVLVRRYALLKEKIEFKKELTSNNLKYSRKENKLVAITNEERLENERLERLLSCEPVENKIVNTHIGDIKLRKYIPMTDIYEINNRVFGEPKAIDETTYDGIVKLIRWIEDKYSSKLNFVFASDKDGVKDVVHADLICEFIETFCVNRLNNWPFIIAVLDNGAWFAVHHNSCDIDVILMKYIKTYIK